MRFQEQKAHQNKIDKLLFVAQPRQSPEDSAFHGGAMERGDHVRLLTVTSRRLPAITLLVKLARPAGCVPRETIVAGSEWTLGTVSRRRKPRVPFTLEPTALVCVERVDD